MDYRKEKNLLIAFDGNVIKAQYDWATGVCYGAKGTQLKGMAAAFKGSVYSCMITSHKWIASHLEDEELALALDRWERLASVGLYTADHDILMDNDYSFPNLKKDFVEYIKRDYNGELSRYAQERFTYAMMPEYQMLNRGNRGIIDNLIQNNQWDFTVEWAVKALVRLQLEDYDYAFDGYGKTYVLNCYYNNCRNMGQENPAITKNFLITICKTAHMYQMWKNEHMNESLKKYNDLKELYYENDTYVMYPLLTAAQFHEEAEAQNNCVERLYMEKVAAGSTHVVVIRKKSAPDQSLITCEISNKWRMIQYLARYNSNPQEPERAFKDEILAYLSSLSQN